MTSRRRRLSTAPLRLAPLFLPLLAVLSASCRTPEPAPSVVLVVVDTLRADHLGLYGHKRETSPHLDARARDAAVFDRAFSTSSWTLPAIASILTGELPFSHGARAVDAAAAEPGAIARGGKTFTRLREGVPTLGERLAARGFTTGAVTSNPFLDPRFGLDRGFGSYDQAPRRRAAAVTDSALAWLASRPPEPFFLLVHYMDPHLPYRPPAEHRGRFTRGIDSDLDYPTEGVQSMRRSLPELGEADRSFLAASYDEEIAFVDIELERLFTGLEDGGSWSDALVILTSDHGEELFEHGGFEHGHSLHDEVLRVPLVVWGPGVVAGRRELPVSLTDVAPTILAAVGSDEVSMSGSSFWPTATGAAGGAARTLLAQDILHGPDQLAAIDWPHKAIVHLDTGELEVFDLSHDPAERVRLNPAGATTERLVSRARAAADRVSEPAAPPTLDTGTIDELRALGYID